MGHGTRIGKAQTAIKPTGRQSPAVHHAHDPVLGGPLLDIPSIIIRDYDATRPEAMRAALPLTLNRNEPDGRLGGCQFSGQFQRYLRDVKPTWLMREERLGYDWTSEPYVIGRLYARLGKERVDAALAVARDHRELTSVATDYQHSISWLMRTCAQVRKLAMAYYRIERRHIVVGHSALG